jgi:hypothetical protein
LRAVLAGCGRWNIDQHARTGHSFDCLARWRNAKGWEWRNDGQGRCLSSLPYAADGRRMRRSAIATRQNDWRAGLSWHLPNLRGTCRLPANRREHGGSNALQSKSGLMVKVDASCGGVDEQAGPSLGPLGGGAQRAGGFGSVGSGVGGRIRDIPASGQALASTHLGSSLEISDFPSAGFDGGGWPDCASPLTSTTG